MFVDPCVVPPTGCSKDPRGGLRVFEQLATYLAFVLKTRSKPSDDALSVKGTAGSDRMRKFES